ncbi:MAG: alanine racemase [Alphaproteobacteria bacterium]|nr:alanine racemase [Alphaproteobacteria bacterium]
MDKSAGILTIDLGALRANYDIIGARLKPGCRAGAVVKADAYGLGAEPVVRALYDHGCRDFFVSSVAEALRIRPAAPQAQIVILNGYYASQADAYVQQNLTPALGSFIEIKNYRALGEKTGRALPAWLSFNVRMNRLGLGAVEEEELRQNPDMLQGIDVRAVMGHFACAEIKDHPMTQEQYAAFLKIAATYPDAAKSLSNSSGLFRSVDYQFDIVRPGMALYGLNPIPEAENPMRPVVRLDVPVIRMRVVYAGAHVGYGATYQFAQDTPLATVSAGYADGLFWALSNRGALYWKGIRCPMRGRVSMDLTTVDLSDVPSDQRPKPGDMMEVLGPHQSPEQLGRDGGSFDYEVLTSLGPRYERRYIG